MTEQEYKELLAIRDGAPKGVTHYDGFQYWLSYGSSADLVITDEEISSEIRGGCNLAGFRSLSDINKRIEMHEQEIKLIAALRSVLGWRELRSHGEFPIERIEDICRNALNPPQEKDDV